MKVLILINKVGLGDCIIHLNYIHEISKKYEKPVSILAKENTRAKDLFQDDPHIKEVITLDRLEDEIGSHDGLRGFIKLIKDIKEKKFLNILYLKKKANILSIQQKFLLRMKLIKLYQHNQNSMSIRIRY